MVPQLPQLKSKSIFFASQNSTVYAVCLIYILIVIEKSQGQMILKIKNKTGNMTPFCPHLLFICQKP